MPLRLRKRFALGPLRINVTQDGVRSVALKLGPFTYNLKTRKSSANLPGPITWSSK